MVMEVLQADVERPIAEAFTGNKSGKKKSAGRAKEESQGRAKGKAGAEQPAGVFDGGSCNADGIRVTEFDHCVENHFTAMDTIAKLCGESEEGDGQIEESEIERFSSTTKFLREWRYFNYESKTIKFACGARSPEGFDAETTVTLPQFSSAAVLKNALPSGANTSLDSRDYVMYVGGPVWALDWCPQVHERNDSHIKCEFIAVSAHPPGSSYHKMGAALTGRGLVQIWCLVNVSVNQEGPNKNEASSHLPSQLKRPRGRPPGSKKNQAPSDPSSQLKRPKGRPRGSKKNQAPSDLSSQPKRPRGRPKKKQVEGSSDNIGNNDQFIKPLFVEYPVGEIDSIPRNSEALLLLENSDGSQSKTLIEVSRCNSEHEVPAPKRRLGKKSKTDNHIDDMKMLSFTENREDGSTVINFQENVINENSVVDPISCNDISNNAKSEVSSTEFTIPENVALPRVVLCLAHNGKVAWDLKWKPSGPCSVKLKHQMGYLAVLLGNGSLEVWEVPSPNVVKAIYWKSGGEGTDPRFVKLNPVFRCSILKSGNTQSIPLTVEWSSTTHDYLLAGCHDGTVALWKFSANSSCQDTRPLLRFSADTVPIRGVAWAPNERDPESANVVLTAGHGGLKFWDLRDPFRPLWDIHPAPRNIYSLDWVSDPRCVILSFDDGTMRVLNLVKAVYAAPLTGKPFPGRKFGFHDYCCSPFAIWSVQVSRLTGMVAYCSADGAVSRFQLTSKEVEKEHSRSRVRAPHFVCGYFTEEQSITTINSLEPYAPLPLKKLTNKSDSPLPPIQANGGTQMIANASTPENETSALCYVNEAGMSSGSEDTPVSIEGKNKSRSKGKMQFNDQALDDEPKIAPANASFSQVTGGKSEVFPPKSVAVHRVRWNMNPGRERWLCSGGAAGILRCQEIVLSDMDKKLMKKK